MTKQIWEVYEFERYIIVVPTPDIKPHGVPSGKRYKITDDSALECACEPIVESGEVQGDEETYIYTEYQRPLVSHRSWLDRERIEEALAKLHYAQPRG